MRDAALRYFAKGWLPLPLAPYSKRPIIDRWRHFQYAVNRPDEATIAGWWNENPDANIGIITGRGSGLVVVDFDATSAIKSPAAFLKRHGLPPCQNLVTTGRGGFHAYYAHPGFEIHNGVCIAQFGDVKLDIRADGGYVVAPPSIHENRAVYTWVTEGVLDPYPDAYRLMADDKPRPTVATSVDDFLHQSTELDRLMRGVSQGERNHAAARLSGWWLKTTKGDIGAAWQALRLWNTQNQPPLEDRELKAVVASIAEKAASDTALSTPLPVMDGPTWAEAVKDIPPRQGIRSVALPILDALGGFCPGDLLLLAGRPGMGKSTLAWNLAADLSLNHHVPTLLFSTEMTAVDVARWMAIYRNGQGYSQDEWIQTLRCISQAPLWICDRGTVKWTELLETVQAYKPKVVIVDHIQRLHGDRAQNRNNQLEEIARDLKSLAKDSGCTVLALAQLNRMSVTSNRRPELYDLRDSGGLEQEADAVVFLWTDAPDFMADPLRMRFSLAKNRHGRVVEQEAWFDRRGKRFTQVPDIRQFERAEQGVQVRQDTAEFEENYV